jgi:hypothetical protein
MNVIVSNKYQQLLANLDIDVIKSINGEFTTDEIIGQFANFFYNKMVLDITAVSGYKNISVIQALSVGLDMTKVVLLLDDSPEVNAPTYLSQLVSMGIYNFTKNLDSIKYLIDNPNQYKDVAAYHQLNGPVPGETPTVASDTAALGSDSSLTSQRVIGLKNITSHAGATTLMYMMKKHLAKAYKVKAVEVDCDDCVYFNDPDIASVDSTGLPTFLTENSDAEVILVDLNNTPVSVCSDVIYLIEPGLIKLNKLIRRNNKIFEELVGKKIVLNRSILNDKDVRDFEKESGSKVFYNMPLLDDKLDYVDSVNDFLVALGFSRFNAGGKSKKFNIF